MIVLPQEARANIPRRSPLTLLGAPLSLFGYPTAIAIIERAVGKLNFGSVLNEISDSSKPEA